MRTETTYNYKVVTQFAIMTVAFGGAVYSIGFFLCWALAAASSAFTWFLSNSK